MMPRSLVLLCLFVFIAGCGKTPPPIEEISRSTAAESSAQPIQMVSDDWNQWRGQQQTGSVENQSVPIEWSDRKNVVWKTPVSGTGHSSPIVVGELIILTSADEQTKSQFVICVHKSNGEQLWSTEVNQGAFPGKHPKNSFASATPASDGQNIFAAFVNHDRVLVVALDFDGNIIWEKTAGDYQSEHGYGPSPTLFENLVIVNGDGRGGGFLAALDRASGEVVWRVRRTTIHQHANYSSPVIATLAGRPQLIQTGYNQTISYDPATGKEIWRVSGPSTVSGNTPAFSDPYVIASGGYPEKLTICIKADGQGDVTNSRVVWSTKKNTAYVPSPIIDGKNVIVLTGDGIATSFEIASGKRVWQERVGGNFSASPVKVGQTFYLTNEQGEVTVFKGGERFVKLGVNKLPSPGGMATPTISGDQLFIRTSSDLYCIQSNDSSAGITEIEQ